MKLCDQVATPDVAIAESATIYESPLQQTCGALAALGYGGVKLLTIDPRKLNRNEVRQYPSMEAYTKHAITHLSPISQKIYGRELHS